MTENLPQAIYSNVEETINPDFEKTASPTWLKVKSQIRAGGPEPPKIGEGPGEVDGQSPALARLVSRTTIIRSRVAAP